MIKVMKDRSPLWQDVKLAAEIDNKHVTLRRKLALMLSSVSASLWKGKNTRVFYTLLAVKPKHLAGSFLPPPMSKRFPTLPSPVKVIFVIRLTYMEWTAFIWPNDSISLSKKAATQAAPAPPKNRNALSSTHKNIPDRKGEV